MKVLLLNLLILHGGEIHDYVVDNNYVVNQNYVLDQTYEDIAHTCAKADACAEKDPRDYLVDDRCWH